VEVFCDLWGASGAVGFLFEELGIDGWGLSGRDGGVAFSRHSVRLLPAAGGLEIDQLDGYLFLGAASFRTDVEHALANDFIAHDELIAAILKDESGAVGSAGRVGRGQRFLKASGVTARCSNKA
jgi:hypothetical protein